MAPQVFFLPLSHQVLNCVSIVSKKMLSAEWLQSWELLIQSNNNLISLPHLHENIHVYSVCVTCLLPLQCVHAVVWMCFPPANQMITFYCIFTPLRSTFACTQLAIGHTLESYSSLITHMCLWYPVMECTAAMNKPIKGVVISTWGSPLHG